MEFLKIFLPLGGFSLSYFFYLFKQKTFSSSDIFVSVFTSYIYILLVLIFELGVIKTSIGFGLNSTILLCIIGIHSLFYLYKKIFFFPLGVFFALLLYILQVYNNSNFSLYLVDFASLFIYSFWVIKLTFSLFKKTKLNEE